MSEIYTKQGPISVDPKVWRWEIVGGTWRARLVVFIAELLGLRWLPLRLAVGSMNEDLWFICFKAKVTQEVASEPHN